MCSLFLGYRINYVVVSLAVLSSGPLGQRTGFIFPLRCNTKFPLVFQNLSYGANRLGCQARVELSSRLLAPQPQTLGQVTEVRLA